MATLYDLELQESNNMIHLFLKDGESASLKLLRDQKEMCAGMGEAGEAILKNLEDPSTDIGKSFARLSQLENDVKEVMKQTGMTAELASLANDTLVRKPNSLEELPDKERSAVQDYWIKKKTCISNLVQKGYSYQEIFS